MRRISEAAKKQKKLRKLHRKKVRRRLCPTHRRLYSFRRLASNGLGRFQKKPANRRAFFFLEIVSDDLKNLRIVDRSLQPLAALSNSERNHILDRGQSRLRVKCSWFGLFLFCRLRIFRCSLLWKFSCAVRLRSIRAGRPCHPRFADGFNSRTEIPPALWD